MPAWAAPFIITLIGEYIIEILDDVSEAMTAELEQTLQGFIVGNTAFWETTKRKVTSYWNAYYRPRMRNEGRPVFRHDEYVGFRLIDQLEAAGSK